MTSLLPLIIDTDPGMDDFLAVQMALAAPGLQTELLTVTGGNCDLDNAVANALRCVEAAGRSDVPVHAGASVGLAGPFAGAAHVHGETGLPIELPAAGTGPDPMSAIDALSARAARHGPRAALAALGPLTNVARLISDYPNRARRFTQVVIMGGALDCPGNVTPFAEFNIWSDPVAANIVLGSGLPIRMVGIDVCRQVELTRDEARRVPGVAGELLDAWFSARPSEARFTMHDPLTIAALIDPSMFTFESTALNVTERGEETGRLARRRSGPLVEWAVDVDASLAKRLCLELLGAG